ncbi:MAG: 23S rRNA (uracil(1939)-C(5))-methyltransferase RlmD [Clostridia bacterium]|nr:23S rRNA (uracil(1939)-C(5))-methyltransferase RlmD [Clostridia bacterium]
MIAQQEKYTVTLEEMNNLGNAVCHIDGMVVFVLGGVTGDVAEIEITKLYPKYALAKIVKINTPSPLRVKRECNAYGCGGCAFLNVSIAEENRIKREYVKSVLKKSKIDADVADVACPVDRKYRNKIVLFWNGTAFGYKKQKSNEIVKHERCILNDEIFDRIARFTEENIEDKRHLVALFMRKSSAKTPEITVCPIFSRESDILKYASELVNEFPSITGVILGISTEKEFVLEKCNFKTLYGEKKLKDRLCSLDFEISPKAFYQVNHACAELLYEKAIELADATKDSSVADLFCGTGTIGIILASKTGASVIGVEIEPSAVSDAKRNAQINKIKNIEFFEGDAKNFDRRVDICIVDPPRKGLSSFMTETLLRLKPQRIVYVSCNPDTLARDIALLAKEYNLSSKVYPFNMFPKTAHIESVVCLTRHNELPLA